MFDVYINSPGCVSHQVVDGFAGFIELLLLADGVGDDGCTVFTVRNVQGQLKALCRLWQGVGREGCIAVDFVDGVTGFTEELRQGGLNVFTASGVQYHHAR